ncbi:hypothetical protein LJK88_34450 [Paenibacillus sp. P26]|nr:hypothetical protein LJK88_34450 [Paenibacillus sp. P26]
MAVYTVRLLRTAQEKLEQAGVLMERMQEQMQSTVSESQRFMERSSVLLQDVQTKLRALDRLFAAMDSAGEAAARVSRSIQAISKSVEDSVLEARKAVHSDQETVNDLTQLTTAGMNLWHRWQANKMSKPEHAAQLHGESIKEE